jgi:hypothetical protein
MPKRKSLPAEQSAQEEPRLDIKGIYEAMASVGREGGLDDKQIAIFLSGSKKLHRGLAFNKTTRAILESLGLECYEDVGTYWEPPKVPFTMSDCLQNFLRHVPHVWGLTTEAAKRTVIDAFLFEVLTSKKDEHGNIIYPHKIWCELEIVRDDVQGIVDYVGGAQSYEPKAPYVIVVEAKKDWPNDGYCQLLAEMYAVMMEAENPRPIYGVLTNEALWQFYKLEVDLKWHQSREYARSFETTNILGILSAIFDSTESR